MDDDDLRNDDALDAAFSDFISQFSDAFYVKGTDKLPSVKIKKVKGVSNPLKYPLALNEIAEIKKVAKVSPFGHGRETKIDPKVRDGMELERHQFQIEDFALDSKTNPMLEEIRLRLAGHVPYITAESYKLLICEKGGFFKPHVDTKYTDGHFGTLILSLPVEKGFEGGALRLSFEGQEIEWHPLQNEKEESKTKEEDGMAWVAFYTDVSHEITKVTSGVRITIALNLIIPEECRDQMVHFTDTSSVERLSLTSYMQTRIKVLEECTTNFYQLHVPQDILLAISDWTGVHEVVDEIDRLIASNTFPSPKESEDAPSEAFLKNHVVCIILGHRYTGKERSLAQLKGRDVAVYQLFSHLYHCFLIPCAVRARVGEWSNEDSTDGESEENEDEENEDEENESGEESDGPGGFETKQKGKFVGQWDEKDSRCTWKIGLGATGHDDWERPKWMEEHNPVYFIPCAMYTTFMNKKHALNNARHVNEVNKYYGNFGSYSLENEYRCTGLIIVKHKVNAPPSNDEDKNKNTKTPKSPRRRRRRKLSEMQQTDEDEKEKSNQDENSTLRRSKRTRRK